MKLNRFLLILAIAIIAVLAVIIWFYPSNSDFRAENPFWNGLKSFSADLQVSQLSSLDGLPAVPQQTTLAVIPYLEFSHSDLQKLEHYVSEGGRLAIMDDYGYGNDILEHLGLEARFSQEQLLDPLFNYKNKKFLKVVDFTSDEPAVEGVESIIFNHATSLENISEDEVIAWSSYFSFLDKNRNGVWDEEELEGPLSVAAKLELGEGEVVLIADPSMLISSMVGMGNNQQFLENIFQGEEADTRVLVDQSHLPETSLDEAKAILGVTRNRIATFWGTLGLIIVALVLTLRPIWRKK